MIENLYFSIDGAMPADILRRVAYDKSKMKRVNIGLDLETNAEVERLAAENDRSISRQVVRLIKLGLTIESGESQSVKQSTSKTRSASPS